MSAIVNSVADTPATLCAFMENNLNARDNGLGDRSLYFGASEIFTCEEAMYHAKIKKISKPRSLQELIVLLKGNIGETLVEWGLGEVISFRQQVECAGEGIYSFVKLHIDFMVDFPNESIVVEVKTTNDVPDTIKESWYHQVMLQMGLSGAKRAKLIAMNLNTGHHKEFDVVFNQLVFEETLKSMKAKWDRIHTPGYIPKGEKSPLCAYCQFKNECSTLKTDNVLPDEVEVMAKRLKEIKKEAKILEENLKAFMEAAEYERARGRDIVIDMPRRSSGQRVDTEKLKLSYPDVYKACLQDLKWSSRMLIY